MEAPDLSLIISFYNKIELLKMLLASLEMQEFKKFEVIIADDGSSQEVVAELKEIIPASSLDIRHIWHEDRGWRKNIILNKAVVASRAEYILFSDGDCILHPMCLKEHMDHRMPATVIAGRRVNLSASISSELSVEKILKGELWGKYQYRILWEGLLKKTGHFENAIYIKSRALRRRINKKDKGILGSHFSLYKEDILAVNGFDERYLAPAAGEDTDLELRLRMNGVKISSLKHIAIQYHFYHKELFRDKKNLELLEQNINKGIVFTPYGIKQD